jgi:DNA mismatch repair protein MutL
MPLIHQLPPDVITKIAAGEVIERPASVVKELLENSIDAGATRIDIELDDGGVERIQVVDNGCGLAADDMPLAFASHATSKLNDADDLFRIGTLGFRGEALASIGGVAHVTLQSRQADQDCGAEIRCTGGELSPVRPWNGAAGTRIEVRHLFFNTPVRKKFLRATNTEIGHICEVFTRLAIAYPDRHLTLRHNSKWVYEVPASATLPDRIGLFFGNEVRDRLYEIRAEHGSAGLTGYVADPSCDRRDAKTQYLFVNGRWIRDRSLGHAIQEAYRGLLMTGRYAVAFLFLDLPPDAVDVNVHPTKSEVRFRDARMLYHLVLATIRERLSAANLVPRLQAPANPFPMPAPVELPFASRPAPPTPDPFPAMGVPPIPPLPHPPMTMPPVAEMPPAPFDAPAAPSGLHYTSTKAIQVHDSYLVLETAEGMLVIDQHALHERILFEQLQRRLKAGSIEKQRLLIPEPIDLSPDEAAKTLEAKGELADLGLEVEDFGSGTVLLQSYPSILGDRVSPVTFFREIVQFLTTQDRAPNREQMLNGLLSTMACKAAVKAGDRLTTDQMDALLSQRHLALDHHHCPHGRPTSLLFSRHELDKQFGRV